MHAVFAVYGMKQEVDFFLDELVHLKLFMEIRRNQEKDKVLVQCQVRFMPGGLIDFVFPKENADAVLTTLRFHEEPPYNIGKELSILGLKKIQPLKYLREFLNLEEIPEFNKDNLLPILLTKNVALIPIGVRYDKELTEADGWVHEAM